MPGRKLVNVRYTSLSSFQIPGLTYLTSAIRHLLPTAQKLCLPESEFPATPENLLRFM
jgi:hypothetical protein